MKPMPRTQQNGIFEYRKVGIQTKVDTATPHKLIQMLLDGAIERIQLARAHMERGETAAKCAAIDWSLAIVDGLRSSLDLEAGGEIAANLDALYDYMTRRLVTANMDNDLGALDEVVKLLKEVREGWNGIAPG